jgi:hypothetical protein
MFDPQKPYLLQNFMTVSDRELFMKEQEAWMDFGPTGKRQQLYPNDYYPMPFYVLCQFKE